MMTVIYSSNADKLLEKMDAQTRKKIITYIDEVALLKNPKSRGKALTGNLKGMWRYRIGDYRALCLIKEKELIISVVKIGHRSIVYK